MTGFSTSSRSSLHFVEEMCFRVALNRFLVLMETNSHTSCILQVGDMAAVRRRCMLGHVQPALLFYEVCFRLILRAFCICE